MFFLCIYHSQLATLIAHGETHNLNNIIKENNLKSNLYIASLCSGRSKHGNHVSPGTASLLMKSRGIGIQLCYDRYLYTI